MTLRAAAEPAIALLRLPSLSVQPGLRHGFSTRAGGVSAAPYRSLNLGLHVGDDPTLVRENRARALAALGLDPRAAVLAEQVHGADVARVGATERGRGALAHEHALPGADALVTDAVGVPLVVLVADCAPVLLYDPVRHAIGAAHAGWRGTAAGIAGRTVAAMRTAYGSRPADLLAGVGPAIGASDYPVGPEVATAMRAGFGSLSASWLGRDGRGRETMDLAAANRDQLRAAGLAPERIEVLGLSTAARTDLFFSYRAEGRTGRCAAILALAPRGDAAR